MGKTDEVMVQRNNNKTIVKLSGKEGASKREHSTWITMLRICKLIENLYTVYNDENLASIKS